MNVMIIGAGNMGSAIAAGLAKKYTDPAELQLTVSNPSAGKLEALKSVCTGARFTQSNVDGIGNADFIILAVKPWILPDVVDEIAPLLDYSRQTIVSVAGGVDLDALDSLLVRDGVLPAVFHVIPDTAAAVGKSMTFIAHHRASDGLVETVKSLFSAVGEVAVVQPRLMGAATALSSCGIAYVYKYIQACVSAGVQLGFYPADALRYVNATVEGAVEMLKANGTLPQQEIDRVTTPGGMTIKGINELDHGGFSSAVINAILKPLQK